MNTPCPVCGKLARFVTQVGPDKVVIRHQASRYEDCVLEGTAGGGHVEHHATGKAMKDEELAAFEKVRTKAIYRCRDFLKSLYIKRAAKDGDHARVSADDARDYCDFNGIERGPWLGAVFRGRHWVWDGITHSKDPIQHAAMLKTWKYMP